MKFCFILVMLLATFSSVKGQSTPVNATPIWGYEPTQEAILPSSLFWSPDSQVLYFSVLRPGQPNLQYNPTTHTLMDNPTIPQTIQLSSAQESHFQASDSTAYVAPDGDTFVYVSTTQTYTSSEGGSTPSLYGIGSLKEQTFWPTRIAVFDGARFRWSDDSSAFVMQYSTPYGGQEGLFYVKGTNSVCTWQFCTFAETILISLNLGDTIYDLSPDGERILYKDYQGIFRLWDVKQDTQFGGMLDAGSTLPIENVVGAAFLADNQDAIWAVNTEGVMRYDLVQQKSQIIDTTINSEWARWVMFSPDNQWAAVLGGEAGPMGWKQLFVLPVSSNA